MVLPTCHVADGGSVGMRPLTIAHRSFRRGKAEALDDAAEMIDVFADGLRDAIDRLGVEKIEQNLRLAAGLVRAQAEQHRSDSRAPVRHSQARQTEPIL